MYNYLKLVFSTPLINIFWDKEQYARFISDPLFYLDTELKMVRDGNLREGIFPIGSLGDERRRVEMQFVHNVDFEEAKMQWDRRKKRINKQNIFIKMGFSIVEKKDEWLGIFQKSNYKKILFYNGDTDIEQIAKTDKFLWENGNRVQEYNYNDYLRASYPYHLDLLRMLNGEKDYIR